jgi:hypothetical protein
VWHSFFLAFLRSSLWIFSSSTVAYSCIQTLNLDPLQNRFRAKSKGFGSASKFASLCLIQSPKVGKNFEQFDIDVDGELDMDEIMINGGAQAKKPQHAETDKSQRLELLQKFQSSGSLRGGLLDNPDDVYSPKLAAIFEQFDTDGDGELDMNEIAAIIQTLNEGRKKVYFFKRVAAVAVLAFVVLLVVNTFLTLWMLQLTKEVHVDSKTNAMTGGKDNAMLLTDGPRAYTLITDIPGLPTIALNSLNRLSFVTTDAGVHNYLVQGEYI